MMKNRDNADGKSGEKMEGEEVLRTVESLRGRLLAERATSRNAKQEAELMGNKLIELEGRLKEETKSRNRAEKRLKFLINKLKSLEIFYVSDESRQSSFIDQSEISTASSVASTSIKAEDKESSFNPNFRIQNIQQSKQNSPRSENEETHSEKSQNDNKLNDKNSLKCSNKEEMILEGGGDEEQDDFVDNSMALIPMDLAKKSIQKIDQSVLDSTVKEVLDALMHAKEKLQTSMMEATFISSLITASIIAHN